MTTQTCKPESARLWFKLREPVNWFVTLVLFVPGFWLLTSLIEPFIAGVICVAVAFCLFFFVLDKRAIGIRCPSCGKHLETNTPWICGNQGCKNDQVDDFPFIYQCQHCLVPPKSYQCHHCGKLIFFTDDHQTTGYARSASVPEKPKRVKKDRHEGEVVNRERDVKLAELDVRKAELDVKLKGYKETLEPPKVLSVGERLRKRVNSRQELEDEIRKLKAEADERFKDDPEARERRHLEIDSETREFL